MVDNFRCLRTLSVHGYNGGSHPLMRKIIGFGVDFYCRDLPLGLGSECNEPLRDSPRPIAVKQDRIRSTEKRDRNKMKWLEAAHTAAMSSCY